METGFTNDFLYTAYRIESTFEDDLGKKKTGTGTAFYVKNKNGDICLVTNRHLVDIDYKKPTNDYKNFQLKNLTVYGRRDDLNNGMPSYKNQFDIMLNYCKIEFSDKYENDIACIIKVVGKSPEGKINPQVGYWIPYEWIASKQAIGEKLTVCDFLAFPGFPEWYDKLNNLPILRAGTIASDPRFDYSYSGNYDGECIAYEAFSFDGSSGSPVFATRKGIKFEGIETDYREVMLVGINAGHLPIQKIRDTHSGISYFYKSSAILDIIDK